MLQQVLCVFFQTEHFKNLMTGILFESTVQNTAAMLYFSLALLPHPNSNKLNHLQIFPKHPFFATYLMQKVCGKTLYWLYLSSQQKNIRNAFCWGPMVVTIHSAFNYGTLCRYTDCRGMVP